MKKIFNISLLALSALVATSCSDWDDHYDEAGISSTEQVDVYNGDIVSYMKSTADVSKMSALYEQNGIYAGMSADKTYTLIVCNNDVYGNGTISEPATFANYSVADISLSPSQLTDGFGIQTRSGKHIWVSTVGNTVKIDDYEIQKTVKTNNGYVYYISGIMPVRKSVYEFLKSLDDSEYSTFKKLVTAYDTAWFDREHSTIIGITQDGSTLYDSVIVTRNTLMDRYDANGLATWNMRDESYNSTMFIPTNTQIDKAINDACDSIQIWLNRKPTASDTTKFKKWIIKACFVDRKLEPEAVNSNIKDIFECVGGYVQVTDVANDKTTYTSEDAAYWLPSVQLANTADVQQLSNGNAYFLQNLKIPNHIVIHRVKTCFKDYWDATNDNNSEYFIWNNWVNRRIQNDAQGAFEWDGDKFPQIDYHVLTAVPSTDAQEDESICSVEYTGITIAKDDKGNVTAKDFSHLPAGEYYLRMGFVHSLTYSLDIYFRDQLDIDNNEFQTITTDMAMSATGSNFHFDRGGASDIPNYGGNYTTGYPEWYNPAEYLELNKYAYLYDTDGWNVGTVKIKQSGKFRIKVASKDAARIWKQNGNTVLDKNNKNQLMMYHWCLRPTPNNY